MEACGRTDRAARSDCLSQFRRTISAYPWEKAFTSGGEIATLTQRIERVTHINPQKETKPALIDHEPSSIHHFMKAPTLTPAAAAAALLLSTLATPAQTTIHTASSGGWNKDSWNSSGSWDSGIPTGTTDVVIGAGNHASANSNINGPTPVYTGNLSLSANSWLEIGQMSTTDDLNALGTGTITLHAGSDLTFRHPANTTTGNDIVMAGDALIALGRSTSAHNKTRTFTGAISGPGRLTIHTTNNNILYLDGTSSWSGGLLAGGSESENKKASIEARATGALGTGDVTLDDGVALVISATDAMGIGAALSLNGGKGAQRSHKLLMNSDNTVAELRVDGVQQTAGTYDSTSTLVDGDGNPLIGGTGTLTVLLNPGGGALMEIAATAPADDATGVLVPGVLTAIFSKPVVLVPGHDITLRNLSDAVDNVIPVGDPRLAVSGNTLTIDPGSALAWNKNYAVQIDPDAVDSDTGVSFAGITDETSWNFSTSVGDPLFVAIADLQDHITGTAPLSAAEIEARKQTIDAEKDRFDESAATITAAFDLVQTYDTTPGFGPLWVNTGQFDRNADNEGDIGWAVLAVMQHIIDVIYADDNIATHEGLLDGLLFRSSAKFPGSIDPPANPGTHTATIDGSYADTAGWPRQHDDWDARKPTGTYLAPGSIVTVTVPPALVDAGYKIRVGAHSWDHEAMNRRWVRRVSRCTTLFDIDSTSVKVANPLGGGIYIEVPYLASAGVVDVDITGAVRAPFFSAKSFHATTLTEWLNVERHHPAPWADFQSEKFLSLIHISEPTRRTIPSRMPSSA